jgi:hypothetical protein
MKILYKNLFNKNTLSKVWLGFFGLTLPSLAFSAQSVEWDVYGTIMGGSGCVMNYDAFVSANGNDLAIVFTRLGVDLPGGGSSILAGRSACSIRVPARIAPGIYIGKLDQRVSYGVVKTPYTRGSIATRSTFFGFPVSPYTVNLPYGISMNSPLFVQSRQDLFSVRTTPSWYYGWCSRNRAPQGLYQANIAISGQKNNRNEDLIMFVDGLDLKYEVVAGTVQCQL